MINISKRVVSAFALLSLALGLLITRIATIETGKYAAVSSQNGRKTTEIAYSRGCIYDCRMERLVNASSSHMLAAKPTAQAMSFFRENMNDTEFEAVSERFRLGYPVFVNAPGSDVLPETQDIFAYEKVIRYSVQPFLSHIIGYLDSGGVKGVSGIEKAFDSELSAASGKLSVSYRTNAFGSMLIGEPAVINDENYNSKAGVALTVDVRLQQILEKSMREGGIDKGAGVILDARTGEIRAMASLPDFSTDTLAAAVSDAENSPLLNRALSAYAVGSVFKTVVAAAALENGISEERIYCCTGSVRENGVDFHCNNRKGHGDMDMKNAMAVSCNTYFITLACELGAKKILKTAEEMGFGQGISLCSSISCMSGVLPREDELDSNAALANFGFGQGRFLAAPLQMAAAYLSIANGGKYLAPTLIKGTVNEYGELDGEDAPVFKRVMSETTAKKLCEILQYTVENGSFSQSRPMNVTSAGKTATAQSGLYENGREVLRSWFAGFFPAQEPQYVVVIMKENGRSGGADCVPVFKSISTEAVNMLFIPD